MTEQLFRWLSERSALHLWLLFAGTAVLMMVIPFLRHIRVLLAGLFSGERPMIHDFSWRLVPEMALTEDERSRYYVAPPVPRTVVSGMAVLLNWQVTGAWRVDLLPVAVDVKGNSAWVTVDADRLTFVLRAHTWRGVLTKEIDLREIRLRYLKTLSLSADDHFGQPASELATAKGLADLYSGVRFSQMASPLPVEIGTLPLVARTVILEPSTDRMEPSGSRLNYVPVLPADRDRLVQRINRQRLVQTCTFDPGKYNQVLDALRQDTDKTPSID